jgi:hypothetical protein
MAKVNEGRKPKKKKRTLDHGDHAIVAGHLSVGPIRYEGFAADNAIHFQCIVIKRLN